jgi:sugar phosphate isomerase/epimerase
MKISLFSVMVPEWDLSTAVTKLADYGYDGIEWRVTNTDPKLKDAPISYWGRNSCTVELDTVLATAPELRKLTDSAGLEVAALAGYHLLAGIDDTKRMLEAAQIMGAPLIRLIPGLYDRNLSYDRQFDQARSLFEETEGFALTAGVRVCIETHPGHITSSVSAARRLLDGLDPKAVGVILDPGNMICEGQEQIPMGLDILGGYLAHVHVKNVSWIRGKEAAEKENSWVCESVPIAEGIVDWKSVLAELKAINYNGYLSFEDFDNSRSSEEKVKSNIRYLRSILV